MELIFILQTALLILTAFIHLYIFGLESFLWTKPATRQAFKISEEEARLTASLAYHQGFYNLFIALGLFKLPDVLCVRSRSSSFCLQATNEKKFASSAPTADSIFYLKNDK